MSVATPNRRPVRLSAGLSVLFGLLAVFHLASGPAGLALAVEVAGLALLTTGLWVARRWSRLVGATLGAVAAIPLLVAPALVYVRTGAPLTLLQVAPGLLGVTLVALGVLPLRGSGSRWLVKLGTALVLLSVLLAGLVGRPGLTALLVGVVVTVLAWDAGEHAIGLGDQLGRRATTWPAELSHLGASVGVGICVVVGGQAVADLGSPGLGLGPFVVLLTGLLALSAALYD
ncbi:hypothetical protein ACKVMT_07250 [Halobacteriales archaeon Cl-PHB]